MTTAVGAEVGADLRRPRSWAAALMSLIIPGLGQLYLRRWKTALLFMLLAQSLFPALALLIVFGVFSLWSFLLCMAVSISIQLGNSTHAFVMARHTEPFVPPWWNRWYSLIGAAVAYVLIGVMGAFLYEDPVKSFHIPAGSMQPSIVEGDRLIGVGLFGTPLQRGEIVIFRKEREGADYIKRIVALGGDSIELRNNRLWVNDREVSREVIGPVISDLRRLEAVRETMGDRRYTVLIASNSDPRYANFSRRVVPPGHVFVLGDNRDNSADSRYFGAVKIEDVHWRASVVFWSRDTNRIGLDLRRR